MRNAWLAFSGPSRPNYKTVLLIANILNFQSDEQYAAKRLLPLCYLRLSRLLSPIAHSIPDGHLAGSFVLETFQ